MSVFTINYLRALIGGFRETSISSLYILAASVSSRNKHTYTLKKIKNQACMLEMVRVAN